MQKHRERIKPIDDLGSGREDFDRDYTAILYSHAFRRLRHKTQVFFAPQSDHVCTRLDHSLYVAAISEIICKNLASKGIICDPYLARTIGIGHDLGHAPFGHGGEKALDCLAKDIGGFEHELHGLRIVDKIEKPRDQKPTVGLNLTLAVRDGIVNHCGENFATEISPREEPDLSGSSVPFTLEGCVVRLVDKIAYLGRDLEDAMEAEILKYEEVPAEIAAIVGSRNGEIVDYFVGDLINESNADLIALSDRAADLMGKLIKFNYERVYRHEKLELYKERVDDVLHVLFERFLTLLTTHEDRIDWYRHEDNLPVIRVFGKYISDRKILYFDEELEGAPNKNALYNRIVIDFLSTLTDGFVFQACQNFFLPGYII